MTKLKNRKLDKFLEKAEDIVDILVFPATLLLAFLVIGSFFLHLEDYEPYATIADYFIISLFVVDLGFKWRHVHNLKKFFKFYWLDILAVFPFYLLTRTYLGFAQFIGGADVQEVFHTIAGLRESQIIKEVKILKTLRGMKLGQRIIRLIALRLRVTHNKMLRRYAAKQRKQLRKRFKR
ncbi:MAG: hypothetical protein AABW84_00020 [Nanoarchaeota archaeon]